MKVYTGIGSRITPIEVCRKMTIIAKTMNMHNYTLRSGGAIGADSAFELGSTNKEIYLPWKNFNGNSSELYPPSDRAMSLAEKYHSHWKYLKEPAKKLLARNVHQILGHNCDTPTEFVICWCQDENKGGTSFALKIAKIYGIKWFNMSKEFVPMREKE